mgnify:CR=1 FL=1
MAESKHEQVAVALQARLAAIVGDAGANYWYTPTHVLRVDDFLVDHLRHEHQLIVQIRPGLDRPVLRTSGTVRREMELYVLSCYRWQPNTQDPYSVSAPTRWTIQSRLARDVEKAVLSDVTFSGLTLYAHVEEVSRDFFIEDSFPWAPVELRLMVAYEHERRTP